MLYRILRSVNTNYSLAVFWLYVLVFGVSLGLIFIFPPLPLILVFVGMALLGVFVIMSRCLSAVEHILARHALRHGTCPMCRQPNPSPALLDDHWQCVHCGAAFLPTGAAVVK